MNDNFIYLFTVGRKAFYFCADSEYFQDLYKDLYEDIFEHGYVGFCWCGEKDRPIYSKIATGLYQSEIDYYLFRIYAKAEEYAMNRCAERINLVSISPAFEYEIIGQDKDGLREMIVVDTESNNVFSVYRNINNDIKATESLRKKNEEYAIKMINSRIIDGFEQFLGKTKEGFYFNMMISKENGYEMINNIFCSWRSITRIARYFRRYGYCAIYWGPNNKLLWHSTKKSRLSLHLPLPSDLFEKVYQRPATIYDYPAYLGEDPFIRRRSRDQFLDDWDAEKLEKAKKRIGGHLSDKEIISKVFRVLSTL